MLTYVCQLAASLGKGNQASRGEGRKGNNSSRGGGRKGNHASRRKGRNKVDSDAHLDDIQTR